MLTEGWDANTVTHILGVRAFGTQLLCEQVVGRGLRRQSYELNDQGLFNVEYADIRASRSRSRAEPWSRCRRPAQAHPCPGPAPARGPGDRFPRIEGYRFDLPNERLTATSPTTAALS